MYPMYRMRKPEIESHALQALEHLLHRETTWRIVFKKMLRVDEIFSSVSTPRKTGTRIAQFCLRPSPVMGAANRCCSVSS